MQIDENVLTNPRWLLTAVFLIAVLLIGGCGQIGGKRDTGSGIPEIYVGTAGFDAAFAAESVPGLVTAGSSSDVVLLLTNNGAVNTPSAIVTVKDTRGAFTLESAKGSDKIFFSKPLIITALGGKESASSTEGSAEGVVLTLKAQEFSKNVEAVDTGLIASVCYEYGTKLTANVCVDASSYSFQKQRKPCDAKAPVALKSQGAPVAIKKIEIVTEKSGNYVKPKFKIYVDNVGTGLIIGKDSLGLFCTDNPETTISKDKLNIVVVEKAELRGKPLKCSDDVPEIKNAIEKILSGKAADDYILCSYDGNDFEDGSGAFVTPLKIELSYGYTSTSNPVPIRIEKGIQCEEGVERSCSITGGGGGTQKCIDGHWTFCQN
ncbi:hypothetical protein HYU16_02365 [Candidatus Woesearchaeota archaeon]|nr:hypothetical protein [Candidatus Woesearchaeota archaeon]